MPRISATKPKRGKATITSLDFIAAMLVPPFEPSPDWAERLAESLQKPKFSISMWEAIGRRFRRNYLAIFSVLIVVWIFKNYSQPTTVVTWAEFVERAKLAPISGEVMLILIALFIVGMIVLAVATLGLQQATGEVLTPYHGLDDLRARLNRQTDPSARPSEHNDKQ
jgi:uncharacterized membrane protein